MLQTFLLMAPANGQEGGAGYSSLIFIVLVMIVFYLFFIRPQTKKAKELKKYREALKKGDKVITIGGIHGKIIDTQETTFTIEVEDGVKLKIEKSAVANDLSQQIAK